MTVFHIIIFKEDFKQIIRNGTFTVSWRANKQWIDEDHLLRMKNRPEYCA